MDDIYHKLYERYVAWAGTVPEGKLTVLIRLTLLFLVPSAILYWAFVNGRRTGGARFLLLIVAELLVLATPIPLPNVAVVRAWILILAVFAVICLPGMLPFLLVPEAGRQRRLRRVFYAVALVMVVIGLLGS